MTFQPETNTIITLTVLDQIVALLDSHDVNYRVIDHPSIDGSAAGSSEVTGTRPEQGAKSLVMMVDNTTPIMVVVRGPDKVDSKAIKQITGSSNVKMASLEEIFQATRTEVGTLPPIGSLFNLPTYFDQQLIAEGEVVFGTGLSTKSIIIDTKDLVAVTNPIIGDFVRKSE